MCKTASERQKQFCDRKRKLGLKEIRSLYAHPEDIKHIREYANKLTMNRFDKKGIDVDRLADALLKKQDSRI